ncbi:hypothetical protein M8494_03725 [Serratia ureilytica]
MRPATNAPAASDASVETSSQIPVPVPARSAVTLLHHIHGLAPIAVPSTLKIR